MRDQYLQFISVTKELLTMRTKNMFPTFIYCKSVHFHTCYSFLNDPRHPCWKKRQSVYVLYNVLCVFWSCFFRSWINDKVVWSSFVGLFQQLSFLCLLLCWDTHFVESPASQLGRFTDLQRCCILLWPTNLNVPITNKFKSDSEHDSYYHSFMTKTNWN